MPPTADGDASDAHSVGGSQGEQRPLREGQPGGASARRLARWGLLCGQRTGQAESGLGVMASGALCQHSKGGFKVWIAASRSV